MTKKKYNLQDFIKPIISDEAIDMELSLLVGDEKVNTGESLSIISGKSKCVEIDYHRWAVELQSLEESAIKISDPDRKGCLL